MARIGFLACDATLPGGGHHRRGDAYEHDLMIAALAPAFAKQGLDLRVVDWEAPLIEFAGLELVMLGTAWNYQDKSEQFIARLEALEASGIIVCNGTDIVRWNATKTYLRELAQRGAATLPTLWQTDVGPNELHEAFNHFDCDALVVKRQIGAGALDQLLIPREKLPDDDWRYGHRAMLQPFLPAIAKEGEFSFIFIDGELCHALRKQPARGDYRIQSLYGGTESVHQPSLSQAIAAAAIIDAMPFAPPLYARIDMLRGPDGALMIMEAELIEPYLYPEQGPELGERLAHAIARRVRDK